MPRLNTYTLARSEVALTGRFSATTRLSFSETAIGVASSSTSEVKLASVLIPANSYGLNDILEVKSLLFKTNSNAGCTIKFYINDTDDLVTPTQIGTVTFPVSTGAANINSLNLFRRLAISVANGTGRGTVVFRNTTSAANDIFFNNSIDPIETRIAIAGGVTNLAIDWTVDNYIIVAGSVVSASDILQYKYLKVNN